MLDPHDHLIVDHDLYNHEGLTEDGIAEAFIEFAKKENLSFFKPSPSVTPFDAVKYQQLMDGLEAVELQFSNVLEDNDLFRIDSEYFKIEYLAKLRQLKNLPYRKIKEFAYVTDGIHESITFDENSIINLISAKSPKENIFDLSGNECISPEQHDKNPRTMLQKDDVIISTVGTIGNCAVVDETILPANSDRHIGIVRIKKDFKPYLLSTFILSKYGRFQTIRESTGNVQLNLFIYKIKTLNIPFLSSKFQDNIEILVQSAHKSLRQLKDLYQQAEDLLLSELNLKDWEPTEETIAVKSFAESFLSYGRFDAEYYQPKFDELIERISSYSTYTRNIKDIQTFNTRGLQPIYSNNGTLNVVNSRHILEQHLDYDNFEKTDLSNWNVQKKARIYKNDILIYTTGANIGRTNVYLTNEQALASNHVNILRLKEEDQIYVGFVINSVIGRLQTEKLSAGSAQAELYPKDIGSFVIPFIAKEKQQQIINKYILSLEKKLQSKQLLEIAKTGVEQAIETDEATATVWMNQQLEALELELT